MIYVFVDRGEAGDETGHGLVFADARVERPVSRALAGEGTAIRKAAVAT